LTGKNSVSSEKNKLQIEHNGPAGQLQERRMRRGKHDDRKKLFSIDTSRALFVGIEKGRKTNCRTSQLM
jgi:hypothetical protein